MLELEELIREEEKAAVKGEQNNKSKQNKEENGKFLDMYSSIYTMRQDLERIKKPLGTRDNPVRTCKDLFYGHPHFTDGEYRIGESSTVRRIRRVKNKFNFTGWYWIDPNLGMTDDAVYVFCNVTGQGETCIFPDIHSRQMPNIPWRKEGDKTDWYSNLRGGFRVRQYNSKTIRNDRLQFPARFLFTAT